jgi:hypothetical protein
MNTNDQLAYWAILVLFFLAFVSMYRKWTRTGNPQVLFAGRFFLGITVALGLAYFFIR